MIPKKKLKYKLIYSLFLLNILVSEAVWVKYGWELFEYVTDARTASLGKANTSYNFNSTQISMVNPYFVSDKEKDISITHQARFAGMINIDLIGLQLGQDSKLMNLNLIYQTSGNIPDTRSMLLDWGLDGQFGTNDQGEGNGILDDGERLDKDKLRYFKQNQIGIHGAVVTKILNYPIGIGCKVLTHSLDDDFAFGIGLDFGLSKKVENYSIGLVFRNIPASGMIWGNGVVEATAPMISLGISRLNTYFSSGNMLINTMLNIDISSSNMNMDSHHKIGKYGLDRSTGLEIIYKENLMIRLGYNRISTFTGGVGLRWKHLGIDYAFLSSTIDGNIGNHHLISICMTIEWLKSKIYN